MDTTDRQLLESFLRHNDEAAFERLVARHGPMVLSVCRRVLQDRHSADDAYQATFLVLARNASSIRRPEALGSWLYGVAYRIAVKLQRAARQSRVTTTGQLPDVPQPQADPVATVVRHELQSLLDEELNHLPEKYRLPLVLCELEGRSNEEVARALGWPASSLSSRLIRARELLRGRLASRGVALSTGLLFPLLAEKATAAAPELVRATVKASILLRVGKTAVAEGVSATALALAEGVIHAMLMTKVKIAAAILLAVALLGTAAGLGMHAAGSARNTPPQVARASEENAPPPAEKPAAAADQAPPAEPPDPVEELRQTLRVPIKNPTSPDELQFRKDMLNKQIAALSQHPRLTVGDMVRALTLPDWRDEDRDVGVREVDQASRKDLAVRFEKSVRQLLDQGNDDQKLAAVTLLGEVGVNVRGVGNRAGLFRDLTPNLTKQMESPSAPLREAAAQALGKINPEPGPATTALGKVLTKDEVGVRRSAAGALADLVKVVTGLAKGRSTTGVDATSEEAFRMAQAVVPVAGQGLNDGDALVRRTCLQALDRSASSILELVADPRNPLEFPPPGRKAGADEFADMAAYRKQVEEERALLMPLARFLQDQVRAILKALDDADPALALMASQVLETMSSARLKLRHKAASVPAAVRGAGTAPLDEDPLLKGLRAAVPLLAKKLTHSDVRLRLAALYVLETMEGEAVEAAPALVKALEDVDSFVRWGAVRALGKMAPRAAAQAVPALAKRLNDDNRDVRITAAAALERYGPAAKSAVPALSKAVGHKEVEMRTWAIRALAAIGPEAQGAVPVLITALGDPETSVRTASAKALGKLGASARSAVEPLRKALKDSDEDVRQAASNSLLMIK